jgi:hypothetical protein
MKIQSARDLKLEIASEVFAPIAKDLLERALNPKLGTILIPSPLQRIALGIAQGKTAGEFTLAVRLQAKSALLNKVVDLVRARAPGEIDVRFVGRVRAHDDVGSAVTDLRKACRPLVSGCSIAHVAFTAGTLGLIARHRKSGRPVITSNAHVLAQAGQAKLGDVVTQPGPMDGATSDNHVAALLDFLPLKLAGSNRIDAAIAVVEDSVPLAPNVLPGFGSFTIPDDDLVLPGMKVMKLGRTTGHSVGEITATEMDDIAVDYDIGTATFDDQIEITGTPDRPFSDRGDSGALPSG